MTYPEKLTSGYYRVKMSWEDKENLGQFRLLSKAKAAADANPGSHVYSNDGVAIYPEWKITDTENVQNSPLYKKEGNRSETVSETTNQSTETTPVAYCRLKIPMNIRSGPSLEAEKITVYQQGTICEVLEVCDSEWLKIDCPESPTGIAYVLNENGTYAHMGSKIYKTVVGDSLGEIAEKKLGCRAMVMQLKAMNGIYGNVLQPNTVLLMP